VYARPEIARISLLTENPTSGCCDSRPLAVVVSSVCFHIRRVFDDDSDACDEEVCGEIEARRGIGLPAGTADATSETRGSNDV
jgi:hypothetical protein